MFAAITSALALAGMRALAPDFVIDRPPGEQPVAAVAALTAVAGVAFASTALLIRSVSLSRGTFAAMIFLGFGLRLIFFGSQPILEDDWRRYLWEGAAVAAGVSPFEHAPAGGFLVDAFGAPVEASPDAGVETLRRLGAARADYPELVNHPYLTTIYPAPVQAAFAVAHQLTPFSLDAWRFVLLASEAASLMLLVRVLPAFGIAAFWSLLYWLNPIVITQTFSAAHMDALIVPPLLAALWAARAARPGLAGAALGLAAGVKLWPLALAPIVLRRFAGAPRALAVALSAMTLIAGLSLAPLLKSVMESDSGLFAYASEWRRSAFAFALIEGAAGAVVSDPGVVARAVVALLTAGAAIALAWKPDADAMHAPARALTFVMILLLLSPTAYAWYVIWAAAFIPFAPTAGACLLSAGAAVYPLRFPNALTGAAPPFLLLGVQIAAPFVLHLISTRRRLS
ncbi:MAG: glycosyltransferase 87 family protein [Parvularculaceae bacterium]|nr:glycosyltransferase 87 family protein [Parvularculaceae bacterium]